MTRMHGMSPPPMKPPSVFSLILCLICTNLLCMSLGCTYANKPLNAVNLTLEARAKNHTMSSTGGQVVRSARTEIVAATNPAEVPAGDNDGYFVGLAISGGGARSAGFGGAGLFGVRRLGVVAG